VEDYYKNLNNLYQVADKEKLLDDTRFQSLLENPVILNEILETGKYNKD
jgi:hypothetical protein